MLVDETCYSDINDCQSFKGLAVMLKSQNNRFNPLRGGQALQEKLALHTLSLAVLVVYAGKKRQQLRR